MPSDDNNAAFLHEVSDFLLRFRREEVASVTGDFLVSHPQNIRFVEVREFSVLRRFVGYGTFPGFFCCAECLILIRRRVGVDLDLAPCRVRAIAGKDEKFHGVFGRAYPHFPSEHLPHNFLERLRFPIKRARHHRIDVRKTPPRTGSPSTGGIATHLKPRVINKTHAIDAIMLAVEDNDRHSRFKDIRQFLRRGAAFVVSSGEVHINFLHAAFAFDIFLHGDDTSQAAFVNAFDFAEDDVSAGIKDFANGIFPFNERIRFHWREQQADETKREHCGGEVVCPIHGKFLLVA